MDYSIIEAMPSIHATLVGFVGAFLCALVVYAMQKIHETSDRLSDAIEQSRISLSPRMYHSDSIEIVLKSGHLDWNKIKKITGTASRFVNGEERKGQHPTDDGVVTAFEELWIVLSHVFVCYPFNGELNGLSLSKAAQDLKDKKFDLGRMSEIRSKLGYLELCRQHYSVNFLALARSYSEVLRARIVKRKLEEIVAMKARFAGQVTEKEMADLISPIENVSEVVLNSEQIILEFCSRVDECSSRLLPVLVEVISARNLWERRLPLKRIVSWGGGFSCFILLVGVFLPSLILSLRSDFNLCAEYNACWASWMGYVLYGVTAVSYFVLALVLWVMLKKSTELG